jgi:GH15 family glucan-1,4-alpha-glucosidase
MAVHTLNEHAVHGDDQHIVVDYVMQPGSRQLLALVGTEREPLFLPRPEEIDQGVDRTIKNGQSWSAEFAWKATWADVVRRSALTLKLLLHAPTGSTAAAATSSLPESLAGGKNWDFRLAWTRDTAYTLNALFRFGLREETHAAVSWLLGTICHHGPQPRVCYRLDGTIAPPPHVHDVGGWRGIGPVFSGNRAADHLQLGVFGDLFTTVRLYVGQGNVLDADTGRMLAGIADIACDQWQSKDAGVWELP